MRRIIATVLGLALVLPVGCVVPKFPDQPKNTLYYTKSMTGGSLSISNGADTTVTLESAHVDPTTKELEVKGLSFDSRQSVNQGKLVEQMTKMTDWLMTNIELNKVYGTNTVNIIDAITRLIPTVAPIIMSGFDAGVAKATINANRGGVVSDLTKLLTEVNKFDPSIISQVIANVKGGVSPAPITPTPTP